MGPTYTWNEIWNIDPNVRAFIFTVHNINSVSPTIGFLYFKCMQALYNPNLRFSVDPASWLHFLMGFWFRSHLRNPEMGPRLLKIWILLHEGHVHGIFVRGGSARLQDSILRERISSLQVLGVLSLLLLQTIVRHQFAGTGRPSVARASIGTPLMQPLDLQWHVWASECIPDRARTSWQLCIL